MTIQLDMANKREETLSSHLEQRLKSLNNIEAEIFQYKEEVSSLKSELEEKDEEIFKLKSDINLLKAETCEATWIKEEMESSLAKENE